MRFLIYEPRHIMKALILAGTIVGNAYAAEPTTRPQSTNSSMTVELPATVSTRRPLPIKLTLDFPQHDGIELSNSSFMFTLLDEDGKEITTSPFWGDALARSLIFDKNHKTYEPRLEFSHWGPAFIKGKRYQLVCVQLSARLICSAWFTLTD